jgi:hypothetical protein
MKKLLDCCTIMLVMNLFASIGFSQVIETTGVKASVTIVEPVSVSTTLNTDFGNGTVIVAGSVELTPVGSHSKKGNIVLPVSMGTFTAYTYYFTGLEGYNYTVSFPASPMIINKGPQAMEVANFVSNPVMNSGSDLIAGVFVSVTPANVTVNYN